jgi:general secretion pathway protein K
MRHACPARQRGAALLTAMIIVTLVTTLASAMVWQQWRAVQIEAAERGRAQAAWILSGALDFAKLIVFENRGTVTALTDPWATPLAEARISTFLAVDKSNADDGPEAFLSGNIDDAQGRFNLRNLVLQGKPDPDGVAILQRLCTAVGIETGIAERIANGLAGASVATSAAAPLTPGTVDQLTWLGVDDASVQALKPYVVLLPTTTPVNVNTASSAVLAAVANLEGGTADHIVTLRQRTPFKTVQEFLAQTPNATLASTALTGLINRLDVHSNYFEVHGRLRLADHVLLERSLLYRVAGGQPTVLERERVASIE